MSGALAKYNELCRAVAAAKSFDEVRDIANKAEALRAYAYQAKNRELELDAAEIRIRAERRLGEMLSGTILQGHPSKCGPRITLTSIGVDYNLSSRAQRLAVQDEASFEIQLAHWRSRALSTGRKAKPHLAAAKADPKSKTAAFRLLDGTPVGQVRLGGLRARCAAAQAEARLLLAISNHLQGSDALATVGDSITESVLANFIADAIEVRS